MSFLGKTIKLTGVSQKGKNRVRENGDTWMVFAETDHILFAPNDTGPWLYISPEGKMHDDKASRWVRATGDKDFIVVGKDT